MHKGNLISQMDGIFKSPAVWVQHNALSLLDACLVRGSCGSLCPFSLDGVWLRYDRCDDVIFLYPCWKSEEVGEREALREGGMEGEKEKE